MFRTKICGITRAVDAVDAQRVGADAIGLNFYAASKRGLSAARAIEIVNELEATVDEKDLPIKVGVFVNHDHDTICEIASAVRLDFVQLHGDEPTLTVEALQKEVQANRFGVIRAVRFRGIAHESWLQIQTEVQRGLLAAVLVDAYSAKEYGGTGERVDWNRVGRLPEMMAGFPLILAGGLNGSNVQTAIRQSGFRAVDVASGVESEPGMKDMDRMKEFVEQSRRGFEGT